MYKLTIIFAEIIYYLQLLMGELHSTKPNLTNTPTATQAKNADKKNHAVLLKESVRQLPTLPGVYRFLDKEQQVLYVGKAIDLKRRVSSYFNRNLAEVRIKHMVSLIHQIETTVTRSEAEALLLENNLIKTLAPRFNILFRDDKSYPYITLSNARFPRLHYFRGLQNKSAQFFGPYPSAWSAREAIEQMQKLFQLRTCNEAVFSNRTRPCLLNQIKRCSAPCVGLISEADYQQSVAQAAQFVLGEHDTILAKLQQDMLDCAQREAFEQAAVLRDRISHLSKVNSLQVIDGDPRHEADIIAIAQHQGHVCINLAMVRVGRHLGDRAYFPTHVQKASVSALSAKNLRDTTETDGTHPAAQAHISSTLHEEQAVLVIEAFITQHYIHLPPPREIICAVAINPDSLKLIGDLHQRKVEWLQHPRAQKKVWLDMAQQGAALALSRLLDQDQLRRIRCQALIEALALDIQDSSTLTIECFDVSHSSGEATQASCVVFAQHQMQSARYRRYNIKDIQEADDYAAMRQVLTRRYPAGAELPDVVLIDGGKGQVSSAAHIFTEMGHDLTRIVGVEKGEGRKVGLEELVFADGRAKLSLAADHPALLLIAQIRDEAHRFAITGMRAQRAKTRVSSSLEAIEGIGTGRRAKLLAKFGSIRAIAAASVEDIANTPGISKTLAEQIYRALH